MPFLSSKVWINTSISSPGSGTSENSVLLIMPSALKPMSTKTSLSVEPTTVPETTSFSRISVNELL